jgi:PIN domain nuclease of toxin-antitoxin system
MTPAILDACALLAIALDEPGAGDVVRHMVPGETYTHAVNAFEVAAKLMAKTVTEDDAWSAAAFGGVITIDEAGGPINRCAARLKYANRHLSLGDCFCLALAEDMKGSVITCDGGFAIAKTSAKVVMFR